MSISSATSWVDGDPLTPTTLNSKLNPLVDAIRDITDSPSVTGSGTSGFVPRWTSLSTLLSNTTLVNGSIRDYGADGVAIGNTPESGQSFLVYGPSKLSGAVTAGGSVTVTGSVSMTGALTVSGSTTSLNGVRYTWPSSQGSADYALLNDGSGALRWGLVGGFVDQAIVSNAFSVYSVATTDINTRLLSSSATMNPVLAFPSSALSGLAVNSRVQVAALGRRAYVNLKLGSRSSRDTSFVPLVETEVLAIAIDADDKILVGGSFLTVGSSNVSSVARLNEDGTLDSTFQNVEPLNAINAILVRPTDYIIGGQSTTSVFRVEPSGVVTSFCGGFNSTVRALARQSDNKVLVGGSFTLASGSTRTALARLNANGTLDSAFSSLFSQDANGVRAIYAISVTTSDKIVIGGGFGGINGQSYAGVARLNTDGSVDTSFVSSIVTGGEVLSLAIQSDGKIVLAGSFLTVASATRNRVARLNADGSLDTTFNPSANNQVYATAVNPFTGDVALGGIFTTMASVTRNNAAVVDSTGSLLAINPNFSQTVNAIAYDGTGRLLFAGGLTSASSGVARYGRLESQASVDTIRSASLSAMQSLTSVPPYGVVTLESRGSGEWVAVDANY